MKNIVTISLIIVVVAVIAILAGAVLLKQPVEQNTQNTTNTQNQNTTAKLVSVVELAGHNTQSDCWMIIDGKAYDVTSYIPKHPAGPEKIIAFCGKDGTQAFNDVHSQKARNMLSNYYVGTIN